MVFHRKWKEPSKTDPTMQELFVGMWKSLAFLIWNIIDHNVEIIMEYRWPIQVVSDRRNNKNWNMSHWCDIWNIMWLLIVIVLRIYFKFEGFGLMSLANENFKTTYYWLCYVVTSDNSCADLQHKHESRTKRMYKMYSFIMKSAPGNLML